MSSREAIIRKSFSERAFENADEERKARFGSCSVFDVYVKSIEDLPFEVPTELYLMEMMIGMHGSPEPGHTDERCANAEMRLNWRHLKHVLKSDAMQQACTFLFWICSGVIYRRVTEDVLEDFQHQLAMSWYLVILEINRKVQNDNEARDWLLGVMPVILVQALYRIMVDAFSEDRSQLVHFADPLLEKLTRVVFYEVAGFQLNDETCRKARRQIFKKMVLDNPFVNQHESLKSQMRREKLENASKKQHPLTFGSEDALPLEETQLEHVMMGREEEKKKSQTSLSPAAAGQTDDISIVPKELSVDRYASVAQRGAELLQRHLDELLPFAEEEPESPQQGHLARSGSRQGRERPHHEKLVDCVTPINPSGRRGSIFGRPEPKRGGKGRKTRTSFAMTAQKSILEKREAEERERRRREDLLKQRIVDDPLPPELCETSLDTTWVSPLTDRLAPGERDRQALRKSAAEAHQLKMAPPNPEMLPPIGKSASAPSLRSGRRRVNSHHSNHEDDDTASTHGFMSVSEKSGLDKSQAAFMRGSARIVEGNQTFFHQKEPPITVEHEVVLFRLQDQLTHFNAKSFGSYMKEFDITSGQRKQRMDPVAMKGAESDYVAEMQELVGGRGTSALKVYESPLQKAKRSPAEAKRSPGGRNAKAAS